MRFHAVADALRRALEVSTSGAPGLIGALITACGCGRPPQMVGRERAAQRVMLMRMSQPAMMPSPHCLDAAPAGMMQLCHRESVVQFINEVG